MFFSPAATASNIIIFPHFNVPLRIAFRRKEEDKKKDLMKANSNFKSTSERRIRETCGFVYSEPARFEVILIKRLVGVLFFFYSFTFFSVLDYSFNLLPFLPNSACVCKICNGIQRKPHGCAKRAGNRRRS